MVASGGARPRLPPGRDRQIWEVLKAFASFGFCKAHAAAFALPTYQSAWLKTHHPAAFLAGVLTHDPGMYPKRLILDDARSLGITVLGLDVNASQQTYVVERLDGVDARYRSEFRPCSPTPAPLDPDLPDGSAYGIRLSLTDVKGISEAEVARVVAGQPFHSLADFWNRAHVSRPVTERLVLAGGFDTIYGIDTIGAASTPVAPDIGASARRTPRRAAAVAPAATARPMTLIGPTATAGDVGMRDVELDARAPVCVTSSPTPRAPVCATPGPVTAPVLATDRSPR